MHDDATAVVPLFDGTTVVWLEPDPPEPLLEPPLEPLEPPLEPPPDEEDDGIVHGGTISVLTLELAGRTSWSCGDEPELCVFAWPPPGVSSTVLDGGGVPELDELPPDEPPDDPPPDEPPEEPELELPLEPLWHG